MLIRSFSAPQFATRATPHLESGTNEPPAWHGAVLQSDVIVPPGRLYAQASLQDLAFSMHDGVEPELAAICALNSERIYAVLAASRISPVLGRGHWADVHGIADFPSLVLRVEWRNAPLRSDEALQVVPVRYTGDTAALTADPRIGLPRAVIMPQSQAYTSIAPQVLTAESERIVCSILNKCSGVSVSDLFAKELHDFSTAFLEHCENMEKIHPNLTFGDIDLHWGRSYLNHIERYLRSLRRTASLPQATFDRSVGALKRLCDAPEDTTMSLRHGGNTLIDFEKGEISFVDIDFTGRGNRASLEDFALVLFGRFHTHTREGKPWQLALGQSAPTAIRRSMITILTKIDDAARKHAMAWRSHGWSSAAFTELAAEFESSLPSALRTALVSKPLVLF